MYLKIYVWLFIVGVSLGCVEFKCERCVTNHLCTFIELKRGGYICITKESFNFRITRTTFRNLNACFKLETGNNISFAKILNNIMINN